MRKNDVLAMWSSALVLAACGSTAVPGDPAAADDTAVCDQASTYLADCFGEEAQAPTGCNVEQAERILGMTCDQLTSDLGKADAWWCLWNPWAPGCTGDDDDTTDDDGTITGQVDFSYDSMGWSVGSIGCALVVAYDVEGEEAGRAHTTVSGSYHIEGLAAGDYSVVLYDRHGEGSDHIPMALTEDPAVAEVSVSGTAEASFLLPNHIDGSEGGLIISEAPRSEEHLDRCARIEQTVTIEDTCGQVVDSYIDIDRDWVVTLTHEDTGEVIDYSTVMCQPADGDHWSWDGCGRGEVGDDVNRITFGRVLPGHYSLEYIRVDLPDRNNIDYESELRWRTTEVSPDRLGFSFEARSDDGVLRLDELVAEPWTLTDPWNDDCEW